MSQPRTTLPLYRAIDLGLAFNDRTYTFAVTAQVLPDIDISWVGRHARPDIYRRHSAVSFIAQPTDDWRQLPNHVFLYRLAQRLDIQRNKFDHRVRAEYGGRLQSPNA